MTTVPEKVIAFLRQNRGTAYCDDCIRRLVGLANRHQVQLVTLTLSVCEGFSRADDSCAHCERNRPKKLTKAN